MADIDSIKTHLLSLLKNGLSDKLTYHNLEHTLDVEKQCLIIAAEEGVTNKNDLLALHIASLYHDSGFLVRHLDHEIASCEFARKYLPQFEISHEMVEQVCRIIMATKFPHEPKSQLDMIICDADLDYLGRSDFRENSINLKKELIAYQYLNEYSDWDSYQLDFFRKHKFFTETSIKKRDSTKKQHFAELEKSIIK